MAKMIRMYIDRFMDLFKRSYSRDIKVKIKISLFYFLLLFIIFSLTRAAFYFSYPDVFGKLPFSELAFTFLYGARFDISTISLYLGIFAVLLFLPVKTPKYIKTVAVIMAFSSAVLIIMLASDFFYFPEVKRHMAEELLLVWGEKEFLLRHIFGYYWWALLLVGGLVAVLIHFTFKFIEKCYPGGGILNVVYMLFAALLVFAGVRGFGNIPLSIHDAYEIKKSSQQVTLMLNGIFVQTQMLSKAQSSSNSYPKEKAFNNVIEMLHSPEEIMKNADYPFMRAIKNEEEFKKYNVIVVLLESWTPKYIDSMRGGNYGVTPNFDEIYNNGIAFGNAYASGRRTVYGISSVLMGINFMPGMQLISEGFEYTKNIMSLPDAFNAKGYTTLFTQAYTKKSMKMDVIAKNVLNFTESYCQEDFPRILEYEKQNTAGFDYELLDFTAKKAGQYHKENKPFFIFSLTGTTHFPYIETLDMFKKYTGNNDEERFLNNLYYSDYAIGNLIKTAKEEGYFDNTVFIFLADHTSGPVLTLDTVKEKFNIPFVIYAPKILEKRKIDYAVSQADVIPTLCHFMNIDASFSACGVNALDESAQHFAFMNDGTVIAFTDGRNYMTHDRKNVLEYFPSKDISGYNEMEEKLLSFDKAVTAAFIYNKWYDPYGDK
ncbi:MAG: LTA synthase family protein [Endomicrobium sp.]|jgi:phosphoglycerol transferase MdoB-like AlkP superfamily enzyme|nr:LTA synthase family protein [Endomicrobium sp.]